MSEQDLESLDSLNQAADDTQADVSDTDNNEQTQGESANDEHDVGWYKKQNNKLFERAKKAEGFEKQPDGSWVKVFKKPEAKPQVVQASQQKQPEVSLKDQYALLQAQVPADDIDEVISYAKFKGISVTEALKSSVVKATLSEKAEMRKSAEVANTSGSKRTTVKVTEDQLVEKASSGNMYDLDPETLAEADINLKKARKR